MKNSVVIKAETHYDFGYQLGSLFKKQISERVNELTEGYSLAASYSDILKNFFPDYIQELQGLADGSQTDFQKILEINCNDVLMRKGCSTIVKEEKGTILIGHNEDTSQKCEPEKVGVFVEAAIGNKNISGYVYFGELLGNAYGWNSKGLYIFMDYIDGIKEKLIPQAVPMYFIFRKVLDCDSIEEALEIFSKNSISTGYHCVIAQQTRIISIEALYENLEMETIVDGHIHTNCFIGSFSGSDTPSLHSKVRIERIQQMLASNRSLESVLLDNTTSPDSICGSSMDTLQSLSTIIVDPRQSRVLSHIFH